MANTLKDRVELVLRRVVILVTSMIMPLITGCGAYGPVPSGSLYVMNGRYYYQYYRAPVRYYYMPPVRQPVMTPYTFNPVQPEPAAPPDLPVSQPTESAARSQPSEPPSTRPRELVDAFGAAVVVDGAKRAVERVTAAEAVEAQRAVKAGRLAAAVRGVVLGGEVVAGISLLEAAAAGLLIYGIIEYFSSGAEVSPDLQYGDERFG